MGGWVGLLPEALWNVPLNAECLESPLLTLPAPGNSVDLLCPFAEKGPPLIVILGVGSQRYLDLGESDLLQIS